MNPTDPHNLRIGYGEDAHRLEAGRPLVLCGVTISDAPAGAIAHSDGDAGLHALADAILSSIALGDIGVLFPDTDPKWAGLDSSQIIQAALIELENRGYELVNVALVITLDRPKLGPLRQTMSTRLANLLSLSTSCVGLSFKTSEGLATTHVQARATVLVGNRL